MVHHPMRESRKPRGKFSIAGGFHLRLEPLEQRAMLSVTSDLGLGGDSTTSGGDPAAIERAALLNFQGADLVGNDGPTAKLGWDLTLLSEEFKNHEAYNPGAPFTPSNPLLDVSGQYVTIGAVTSGSARELKNQLTSLGMQSAITAGPLVEGRLLISSLDQLAGLAGVRFVNPNYKPITRAGLVHDQGDNAMRSEVARFEFGVTGAGVTVGILSDSFNNVGYVVDGDGMAIDISIDDLPANTTVLEDALFGTDEGRALAQIVHDVAPGAAIQFATAEGGQAHFADNIRRLADGGSNIIVDDIIYFAEPMFQDGLVAQAVNDVVSQGVSYFSAAGNDRDNAYASAFVDSGVIGRNGGKLHDFDPGPGVATLQEIRIPVGGSFFPVLQWDQPFGSLGGPGSASDMNIELLSSTGQILSGIVSPDNIGGDPIEIWSFVNGGTSTQFFVRIEFLEGAVPGRIQYVNFGSGSTIRTFPTQSGTDYGHANTAGALGVAAAAYFFTPHFGQDPPQVNTFSAKGGIPILFDTSGNRLAVPFDTQSPQVTGPDGANTTFFGALGSRDHESDRLPNFYGTSASAPHVAAVAALMLEAAGGVDSLTPEQIYTIMQDTAVDILQRRDVDAPAVTLDIPGGTGVDLYSGHGLVNAFLAVQLAAGQISIGPDVIHDEGDGGITKFIFNISFVGAPNKIATIAYTTIDDSATSPGDFAVQTGTLTFGGTNPTTQSVTVSIVTDTTAESDETFFVRLSNPSNAALGRNQAIGRIVNDDVGVSISDVTAREGDAGTTNAVFAITAVGLVDHAISVSYTTLNVTASAASDYQPSAGAVTFAPGGGTINVTVPVFGDKLNESTETFQVMLASPNGARITKAIGVGTILDNDPLPSLYVNDVQVTTTEAGNFDAVFTVVLGASSGQQVKVNYATAHGTALDGVDYTARAGVLTFAPGVTSQSVSVPVTTSSTPGPNKTFFLNLFTPFNAATADAQGVGTIVFGSPPPAERVIDNGDAGYSETSGWTNVTNTLAYQVDYSYHAAGTANDRATWTFGSLAPGQYQVFTRWIPFSNRATNAPFTTLDGASPIATVSVNQQLAPAGDASNGIVWQSLGTFQISTGTLAVRLGSNANGFVIADAVRVVGDGVVQQDPEIDVSGFGLSIGTGDSSPQEADGTDFGDVTTSTDSPPVHTLVVSNNGNASLHLTGSPRVAIVGANPADFEIVSQPSATIGPASQSSFQVRFHPTAVGLRQAIISVANDDQSEHPYTFAVQGNGIPAPAIAHNAALPLDVNGDERISSFDALLVISELLSPSPAASAAAPLAVTAAASSATTFSYYVDVNGDGRVSPLDALAVINYLLTPRPPGGSSPAPLASAAASAASPADALAVAAVDQAISGMDDSDSAVLRSADEPVVAPTVSTASPSAPTQVILSSSSVRAAFASGARKTGVQSELDPDLTAMDD